MATQFIVSTGEDLDALLRPRGAAPPLSPTQFVTSAGQDLGDRYLSAGGIGDQLASDTKFVTSGSGDIKNLFWSLAAPGPSGFALAVITVQPVGGSASVGTPFGLSVTATSATDMSFHWEKNGVDIPGATSSTYNVPSTTSADSGSYVAKVSNAGGTVVSNAVTVTISEVPATVTGGTMTTGNKTYSVGAAVANLTATVSGSNISYGFYELINGSYVQQNSGLSLAVSTQGVVGTRTFKFLVSNVGGSDQEIVTVSFTDVAPTITGGTITMGPLNYNTGNVITFTVVATGTNLVYAWDKGGSPLVGYGANGPQFVATLGSTGTYNVVVSNSAGSDSQNAVLTITDTAPVIVGGTINTASYNMHPGDVANFNVAVQGANPVFVWSYDNGGGYVVIPNGQQGVNNSQGPVYAPVANDNSGFYKVVVTNSGGSDTAISQLTVADEAPVITGGSITGGPYSLNTGDDALWSVVATGTNLLHYWLWDPGDGFALIQSVREAQPAPYNNLGPQFPDSVPGDSGIFRCVVYNSAGTDTQDAVISVTDP